jgi:hypothetical protein
MDREKPLNSFAVVSIYCRKILKEIHVFQVATRYTSNTKYHPDEAEVGKVTTEKDEGGGGHQSTVHFARGQSVLPAESQLPRLLILQSSRSHLKRQ